MIDWGQFHIGAVVVRALISPFMLFFYTVRLFINLVHYFLMGILVEAARKKLLSDFQKNEQAIVRYIRPECSLMLDLSRVDVTVRGENPNLAELERKHDFRANFTDISEGVVRLNTDLRRLLDFMGSNEKGVQEKMRQAQHLLETRLREKYAFANTVGSVYAKQLENLKRDRSAMIEKLKNAEKYLKSVKDEVKTGIRDGYARYIL